MIIGNCRIAIVVPVRNEEGNVSQLMKSFKLSGIDNSNIFIIEGNSSDQTYDELIRLNSKLDNKFKIMQQIFRGKFGATKTFLMHEESKKFTHVFVWDGDMTIPFYDNLQLLELARNNPEAFVTGSRFASALRNKSIPLLNFVGNIFFSILWCVLTLSKPIDVLCGSKIALISDLNKLPPKLFDLDYYGDIAMLFSAKQNSRKLLVRKVNYVNRSYGTSNIKPFSGGLRILLAIFICVWHFRRPKSG